MKTNNVSNKFQNILDGFEILVESVTGLPLETVLDKHNFILRTGTRYPSAKNDIFRNFYYHAPNGNREVQEYYREKDLAARKAAQEESNRKGGKSSPINNQNHIQGYDQLVEWLKDGVVEQRALFFAPHSIDSGITKEEVNKFGTKCRVIRIENDDQVEFETKLEYFKQLGLPTESLLLHSGSKSPHHIFTFGNGENLPELEWEQVAELEAQMLRHSGFDGYHKTIKQIINDSKTMMLRIPGSFHQKTKGETHILGYGNWWNIEYLEQAVYSKFTKLGEYKIRVKHGDLIDTYEAGVQDFEKVILSPSWVKRFKPYESSAEEQARSLKVEKERQNKLEQDRLKREQRRLEDLQTLTPEEIQRRQQLAVDSEWHILDLVSPSVRSEIENGTADGLGRSHRSAFSVALALLEAESALKQYNLRYTESAENIYADWINKTFVASERSNILKVQKVFRDYQGKISAKPWQLNKIENLLYKKQDIAIAKEVITPLVQGKNIQHLVEEATRGLKTKTEKLTVDDLPLVFKNWKQAIATLENTKLVYATTSAAHALEILGTGIGFCVYVTEKTHPLLLHQLAEICAENGYQIAFAANAPHSDRYLAEQIRNGHFSELAKALNRDRKVKIHKPECIVFDGLFVWGAQYYWQRIGQIIRPEMIGNRSNKTAIYTGFAGNSQWFSDVLSQCEQQASSKKLLALISEMGTGKTEATARTIKNWGQRVLAVAHRETLTSQAAKRLKLVYYKDPQYLSALDKYLKGQENGLAVTINTLVQGSTDQGYLPDFQIDDWKDTTLFIDEAESFIKYLVESGTIAENRQKAIEAIRKTVRFVAGNGGRVVLADANLTTKTIKLFEKWIAGEAHSADTRNAEYNAYVVLNSYKKLQGRKLISVDTTDEVLTELTNSVNNGDKAMYFTDVKAASSRYCFSTQSYGMYTREVLGNGHILDADTKQFTDDVDHNLLDRIHPTLQSAFGGCVISVSPVIDSGTDWNKLGLRYVFACYKGIMGLDNTLQQLERVRDNVPRWISATRRSTIGIGKTDIVNLEKRFDEIRNSYKNVQERLIKTWSDYQQLQREEIEERLKTMFPKIDEDLLEWWKDSLLEGFYGAQEFRINLLGRMAEKGYEIETSSAPVDASLIDTIKEFGQAKQDEKYDEIANADLALLSEIDKNDDTMPKATSRAKDLKSCLNALSIKDNQWTLNFTSEERLELVKRTLGKKSKMRRKLIYGFAMRCQMVNTQNEIVDVLAYTDDFRAAISSASRSIKDTPTSIKSAVDFLMDTLGLKEFAIYLYHQAVERGVGTEGQIRMFLTNQMEKVRDMNKKLLASADYVRKTFGFKVDPRPDYCGRNVSELFKAIGFHSENKRNRDEEAGKTGHGGNRVVHNYVITEDAINFKVWKCWVEQFNKKDCEFLKYFYNPGGDEGGDAIWQKQLGILEVQKKYKTPVNFNYQQSMKLTA